MINNPYYSEAKGVPQSYGAYNGKAMQGMPGASMQAMQGSPMPNMAHGLNMPPGVANGGYHPPMIPGVGAPGVGVPGVGAPGGLPVEESYIENILRLNVGKVATLYMTYENNSEWNAKIFKGVVEAAGRDHIIISDPQTGMRHLLLMVNLDYATFDEELQYTYPIRTQSYMFG